MTFNTDETETLFYVRMVVSSISLIGNLFIILAFILFRDLRGFTFRLILMLSISNSLYSIGFLIPSYGVC